MSSEMPSPVKFTDAAANKVSTLIEEEGNDQLKLRVFITGGGCSGFQYGFTFEEEIKEVSLRPSRNEAGVFKIFCGNELIWCRKKDNGFPEIKVLKQLIRDQIIPEKNLGHIDR